MKNLTILLIILSVAACGLTKQDEIKALKDEVMELHDEVMPKMGELRRTRKDLLLQADSIMETSADRAAMLTSVADDIDDANQSMMDWMHQFEFEFDGSDEEVIQYFEGQKVAIQKVNDDMMGSLAKGKEVLAN